MKDIESVWNDIRNKVFFDNYLLFPLRERNLALSSFLVWKNSWGEGGVLLRDKIFNLITISMQQNCKVKDMGVRREIFWVWEFKWKMMVS